MKKTVTQLKNINKNLKKETNAIFCIKRINTINMQLLLKLTNTFNNILKIPMI